MRLFFRSFHAFCYCVFLCMAPLILCSLKSSSRMCCASLLLFIFGFASGSFSRFQTDILSVLPRFKRTNFMIQEWNEHITLLTDFLTHSNGKYKFKIEFPQNTHNRSECFNELEYLWIMIDATANRHQVVLSGVFSSEMKNRQIFYDLLFKRYWIQCNLKSGPYVVRPKNVTWWNLRFIGVFSI